MNLETLTSLERFGEKSAHNLLAGLENSRQRPFDRVLFALGIRHVGSTVARTLASKFLNLEALKTASVEELEDIDQIGPTIARTTHGFFTTAETVALLEKLRAAGLRLEHEPTEPVDSYFSDKDKADATLWDEPVCPDSAYVVLSVYGGEIRDIKAFAWNEQQSDFVPVEILPVGD